MNFKLKMYIFGFLILCSPLTCIPGGTFYKTFSCFSFVDFLGYEDFGNCIAEVSILQQQFFSPGIEFPLRGRLQVSLLALLLVIREL